jgi:hypothetical protein
MNQFLSELYGTGTTKTAAEQPATPEPAPSPATEEEIEKMAQLALLADDAAARGIDLSQYSDEEILKTAAEVYGGGAPEQEAPADQEAIEKFAEYDFGGRIMAHAFEQERELIAMEKAGARRKAVVSRSGGASLTEEEAKTLAQQLSAQHSTAKPLQTAQDAAKYEGAAAAGRHAGGHGQATKLDEALFKLRTGTERLPGTVKARARGAGQDVAKTWGSGAKGKAKLIAAGLGAAGALGGVGYGGYRGVQALREKKSSAVDQLIQRRAVEKLAAHGWIDDQGNILAPPPAGQEKVAEDFEAQVDAAALQYLAELGYPVE